MARFLNISHKTNKMDKKIPKSEQLNRKAAVVGKILAILLSVSVLILIIINMARANIKETSLSIAIVDKGTIETSISASGNVQSASELIINSPINTRLLEVYCKNGDSIAEGTRLLRLNLDDIRAEYQKMLDEAEIRRQQLQQQQMNDNTVLANMEMNITISEMEFNRLQSELKNERHLDSIGSGTTEKVRQCEMAVTTARLKLEQSREQLKTERDIRASNHKVSRLQYEIFARQLDDTRSKLDEAEMLSPRSGTITFVSDKIGSQISAGSHVATLSDLSRFKVSALVGDNVSEHLAIGKSVIVRIGKEVLKGCISNAAAKSEGGNISFDVMLEEPSHPKLRYGQRVDVYILHRIREDVLRIKNGNYYKGAGEYLFFVKSGDKLVRRTVRLGNSNYDYVEVVEGLEEGDEVVINSMDNYKHKKEIKLK